MITWLIRRTKVYQDLAARVLDLERHFVTSRDPNGEVTETLADVPVEKREKLRGRSMRGLSWPQRRALLEATDGGRVVVDGRR